MPQLENGFVYLWALFAIALAGIVMAGTGQVWQAKSLREKEAELLYIGEQFRKAVMSYYNTGPKQYPESLEDLLHDTRTPAVKRHLRKIYTDPITNTAEWGLIEESPSGNSSASNKSATLANSPTPNKNPTLGNSSAPSNNQASSDSPPAPNDNSTSDSAASSSSSLISSSINKRIIGVYSLSEKKPIKKDKFPEHFKKFSEALTHQDWKFAYKPGDTSNSTNPASNQSKPNATSPTASPFAPPSSSTGNASPFAPQSSSAANPNAPTPGFPPAQ
ncbi:MAG: hypothetical protein IPP22_02805 [Nitrosomonas sp.]|nr:hypothetical protein [Nitrosomonas sp.]